MLLAASIDHTAASKLRPAVETEPSERPGARTHMTQVRSSPFLTRPWEAGITGWIVVFGGLLELVAGIVTNSMSTAIAAPILIAPAAIAIGFAVAGTG